MLSHASAAELSLSLRPRTNEDAPFIERLFRSTREEELAIMGMPEEFAGRMVAQQIFAQINHFEHIYPDAEWMIVLQAGEPVGRLYVDEQADGFWLIDISLLPDRRGQGIGAALLAGLLERAAGAGKPIGLSVFKGNPARRLYERFGFTLVSDDGAYERMGWRPANAT